MDVKIHTHIGCYGIIVKDNKILLIKKARGAYKGKYDLPGGSFEHGETPEECVKREILEETGLEVKKLELVDASSVTLFWNRLEVLEDLHHIGIFYKIELFDDKLKVTTDGEDSLGCKWHELGSLKHKQLSPFVKYVINKYLNKK